MIFKIGKRNVGIKFPPLIVVEIGINHNGSINEAKKLVAKAKKAGANILVSGSTIFKENRGDLKKNIEILRTN